MRLSVSSRTVLDVALVLLLVLTGWRMLDARNRATVVGKNSESTPSVKRGDILRLPGVNWSASRTVVLVVSTTCPACDSSTPFYKKLAALVTPDLDVVTVAAEPPDAVSGWLQAKGVSLTRIHQASDLTSLGLHMTPVLLIVDRAGGVTDIMNKRLQPADEARVLDRLQQATAGPLDNSGQVHEFSEEELKHIRNVRLLDVRSRERFDAGHLPGASNIPLAELDSRAELELDREEPVVVDCLSPNAIGCRAAAWGLVSQGFGDVGVLIKR